LAQSARPTAFLSRLLAWLGLSVAPTAATAQVSNTDKFLGGLFFFVFSVETRRLQMDTDRMSVGT
jgi:hypothetical protein